MILCLGLFEVKIRLATRGSHSAPRRKRLVVTMQPFSFSGVQSVVENGYELTLQEVTEWRDNPQTFFDLIDAWANHE